MRIRALKCQNFSFDADFLATKAIVWCTLPLFDQAHFKGRKNALKYGQNYRRFQNLLEVHTWHEHKSVGQFQGKMQDQLFSPFWPLFPYIVIRIFIAKYMQMTPQSTRIACRSFL